MMRPPCRNESIRAGSWSESHHYGNQPEGTSIQSRIRGTNSARTALSRIASGRSRCLSGRLPRRTGPLPAKLIGQHTGTHLLDRAGGKLAKAEGTITDPDQPVHHQPDLLHCAAHLAIAALADADRQPGIRALHPVEHHIHGLEFLALDDKPLAEPFESGVLGLPVRPHPVFPHPSGRGQLQAALYPAIIRQQQQALGRDVQPADAHHAAKLGRQAPEDGWPSLLVTFGRHQTGGLVIAPKPGRLGLADLVPIDLDPVIRADIQRWTLDPPTIDRHTAGEDHALDLAARGNPCPRQPFRDSLRTAIVFIFCHAPSYRQQGWPASIIRNRSEPMFASHMELALEEARRAAARGEAPIGAVLSAPDGNVLASAGNQVRELADPTAHAELLVIRAAALALGSERRTGRGLAVTLAPCALCAGARQLGRVARVPSGR